MRFEQLEYVAAVARLGSFRAAAEAHHISQPALSETVRNLERELDVRLLDRKQSGAKISQSGRELLPYIVTALESIDQLRQAANVQRRASRTVRLGTVNTATVPLVAPTVRRFHDTHPGSQVEMIGLQQAEIHRSLLEGSVDLGLVNYLDGDDHPTDIDTTELLRGRVVACMPATDVLATRSVVTINDLRERPLIMMRSGYVMHRFLHRLFEGGAPPIAYSTDGAEMGKVMVAEGLGITLLPDFSVAGDALERHGVITHRPLDVGERASGVTLVVQRQRSRTSPLATEDLHRLFVECARSVAAAQGTPIGSSETPS